MAAEKKSKKEDGEIINWTVSEIEKYEKNKGWYLLAGIITIAILIYSFITANFLFAVIIIIAAIVVILNEGREPEKIKFTITDEGVKVGKKFTDYDELKNFSIIYRPRRDIKRLYFEFKNGLRPRISIYLDNINPLKIREILLKYLPEDLERENEPLSESLSRFFKI